MLYFVFFHGLIFLHNDTGQQRAVAYLMDANGIVWPVYSALPNTLPLSLATFGAVKGSPSKDDFALCFSHSVVGSPSHSSSESCS